MPAQIDFDGGSEPAQCPVGVGGLGQRVRERGLGQVHLGGDPPHPALIGPAVAIQQADGGRVAGERPVGEGVDDADPHGVDLKTARPGDPKITTPEEEVDVADQPGAAAHTETGDGLDPVAGTARWTAAIRALESARPDRLSDDPLAATLAGEPGRACRSRWGRLERRDRGAHSLLRRRDYRHRRWPRQPRAGRAPRRQHGHPRLPPRSSHHYHSIRA